MTALCQPPNMFQQLLFDPSPSLAYSADEDDYFEELQSIAAPGNSIFEFDCSNLDDITLQPLTAAFTTCFYSATSGDVTSGLDGGSCDPMFGDDSCRTLPSIDCIFGQRCLQSGTSSGSSETGTCGAAYNSLNHLNSSLSTVSSTNVATTNGSTDVDFSVSMTAVNYRHLLQGLSFQTPVSSTTSLCSPLDHLNDSGDVDTWSWNGSPPPSLSSSLTDSDVGPDTCMFSGELADSSNETLLKSTVKTTKKPRKNSESTSSVVSNASSNDSTRSVPVAPTGIQRRRREKSRTPHLWKFMRALLEDDTYNPEYIRWENRSAGVFRIVPGQSKHIAVLWGLKKKNPSMTFDKLSRSLRWCRKNGFLDDVPKTGRYPKKLCFRFAPFALEWKPDTSISIPSMPAPPASS